MKTSRLYYNVLTKHSPRCRSSAISTGTRPGCQDACWRLPVPAWRRARRLDLPAIRLCRRSGICRRCAERYCCRRHAAAPRTRRRPATASPRTRTESFGRPMTDILVYITKTIFSMCLFYKLYIIFFYYYFFSYRRRAVRRCSMTYNRLRSPFCASGFRRGKDYGIDFSDVRGALVSAALSPPVKWKKNSL